MRAFLKYFILCLSTFNLYADGYFLDPTTVPGGGTSPDISRPTDNEAGYSQTTCSATGQYVYAIWQRNNGTHYIIQVAISSDYGVTWWRNFS